LTLVFTGDLDVAQLRTSVAKLFGHWPRGSRPSASLAAPEREKARRVLLIDSPGSVQTYFWIGNVGVDRHYRDRAALDLVNTLYGGRFTSILNTELRIKSGLSYGARSGFTQGTVAGEFSIRSFAQTENTGKAIDLAIQTLRQLKREGVTTEMLDSARSYVLGQYPLEFETAADWAAALSDMELYRLGPDYINDYGRQLRQVTLQEARSVIDRAFPDPDSVAIVLIGDAARIRDQVAAYGPVTEIPLTRPAFNSAD
jgi:predicted Zn-dependent peptidase